MFQKVSLLYAGPTAKLGSLFEGQPLFRIVRLPSKPVERIADIFIAEVALFFMCDWNGHEVCLSDCNFSILQAILLQK